MRRGREKCSDLERLGAAGEAAAPAAVALVGEGGCQGEEEGKDGGEANEGKDKGARLKSELVVCCMWKAEGIS